MRTTFSIDHWELKAPFVTASEEVFSIETLTVYLENRNGTGRGEALGVDYLGETAQSMSHQVMGVSRELDAGTDRQGLLSLLPPGGARNAVDCALWDLECRRAGRRAWEQAGVEPSPVRTLYTLSLDSAEAMAREAAAHARMPALKLKLDADDPAGKLAAVRAARPDADLVIDANGGWSIGLLRDLLPALTAHRVELVEQPLPRGADGDLDDLECPVPLCADESCQHAGELDDISGRYQAVNIKLDKCGGLTAGLALARDCHERGLDVFVGNMLGSSLSMAQAFPLTPFARWVDLDGPLWQRGDYDPPIRYDDGVMNPPAPGLWA